VSATPSVQHIGGYNLGIMEAFWDNISPDLLIVDFIDSAFGPIPEGPNSIAFIKVPSLLRSQLQTPKHSISIAQHNPGIPCSETNGRRRRHPLSPQSVVLRFVGLDGNGAKFSGQASHKRRSRTFPVVAMQLHKPNWKKFLSLKPDRNVLRDDSYFANATSPAVSAQVDEPPTPSSPTKKRKRTDEEIAQRKEKKLRSKANGEKEWQSLSNGNPNPSIPESTDGTSNEKEGEDAEGDGKAISQPASDALLSSKAKEIAKARREEKRKEKSTPTQSKTPEKPTVASGDEKKANEVDEYLREYDAHVNKGSDWKFKKQHQNWILKNLYTHAWKSDELLYLYLKSIQGQARERFVAGATEVTKAEEGKFTEDALRRAHAILELK
jgi:hypothetical protein